MGLTLKNIYNAPLTYRRATALVHDLMAVCAAWCLAYVLRFNVAIPPPLFLVQMLAMLPIVLGLQGLCFWRFGLYRGMWRFASLPDLLRIVQAVGTGSLAVFVLLFLQTRLVGVPRSVLLLYPVLLIGMLSGSRLLVRLVKERFVLKNLENRQKVLIVGAGQAGESLVRDLKRQGSALEPIVFLDDDLLKIGREIHGLPIMGPIDLLQTIVKRYDIELVILAVPSAPAAFVRKVVSLCEAIAVKVRTLPALNDLVQGLVTFDHLREISLEDLLGRDPVKLDWPQIQANIVGSTILVTGAGGSIGSELCRQIAALKPATLVLLDNSEYNLFTIERELQTKYPQVQLVAALGSVTDPITLATVFSAYRPKQVYHAAAYKHVPMLEGHWRAAAFNNVWGTWQVVQAALAHAVETFVLVSTDKAVNPTNVMGLSKRIAEMICQAQDPNGVTRFMTVRFGNVLGSRGSVVEIFKQQIQQGIPLTITHPEMTRYFMTMQEAAQLILQAASLKHSGEICVLDMGEPLLIENLAAQLAKLAGKTLHTDVPVAYIGLRPGEKLHEELFHDKETLQATTHRKILIAAKRSVPTNLYSTLVQLEFAIQQGEAAVRDLLCGLVPEYKMTQEEVPCADH